MSCAVKLSEIPPKLQFFLNENLKVTQISGRRNEFKKDFKLCHLDGGQEYLLMPLGYRSRIVDGTLSEPTLDYTEQPDLRPNSEFLYPPIEAGVIESFSLRDNQVDIVNQALDNLHRYSTALMDLSCSFGKTLLSMYIAIQLGYKFMFVTPRKNLKDQTSNEAGRLCSSKVQIVTTGKKIDLTAQGYIISSHILKNYSQDDFPGVGVLILDELHLLFTPTFIPTLFNYQPLYIIGLSATPYRKDGLGDAFDMFMDPRSKVSIEIHKPIHLIVAHTHLTPPTVYNVDGGLNYETIQKAQKNCEWRNHNIALLAVYFMDEKVIVACKRKGQVNMIIEELRAMGLNPARMMENDTSYDRSSPILVGIVEKMGVGMDGDHDIIIMASSIKAGTKKAEQNAIHQLVRRVGRRVGSEPTVVDVVDDHATLVRHFNSRMPFYKKQGILSRRDFIMTERYMIEK